MKLYLGSFTRLHTQQGLDGDNVVVADAVSRWMYRLGRELSCKVDWDESPTAPFEIIEMGEATVEMLSRANEPHVNGIQLWLPLKITEPFELRLLNERIVRVGSSHDFFKWSIAQTPESIFRNLGRLSRRSVEFKLPLLTMLPPNA